MDNITYDDDGYQLSSHKLKRPFKMSDGNMIEEITYREPTAGDYEIMDSFSGENEKFVNLIARTAKMPILDVKRLPATEFISIKNDIAVFLAKGVGTLPQEIMAAVETQLGSA